MASPQEKKRAPIQRKIVKEFSNLRAAQMVDEAGSIPLTSEEEKIADQVAEENIREEFGLGEED